MLNRDPKCAKWCLPRIKNFGPRRNQTDKSNVIQKVVRNSCEFYSVPVKLKLSSGFGIWTTMETMRFSQSRITTRHHVYGLVCNVVNACSNLRGGSVQNRKKTIRGVFGCMGVLETMIYVVICF